MVKRDLATILWFIAGWWGGELVAGLMNLPWLLSFVPGIALAALVRWDPAHVLWSSSSAGTRRVRPINELAAELDGDAARRTQAGTDRASG